jgi:8-oxo-dGTP pyrophosphatase MutT (NUDIX family)
VEQLSSRPVYRNAWMTVREDTVRRGDGTTGIYGVVDKPDFALVLPRHEDGFWLVEQYRYAVRRRAWEFPQGSWGSGGTGFDHPVDSAALADSTDSAALARAELAEETGLRARDVEHLGHLHAAYGFCSQGFDVYLATGLEQGRPDREATEQDMVHRPFTDAQIEALVLGGGMVDAPSLAALTLYRLRQASSR